MTRRGCWYCSTPSPWLTQVGISDQPCVSVTFGPTGKRSRLNTHSGVTLPARQLPTDSLGLLTWLSTWPPVNCTSASLPDLNGT